MSIQVRSPLPGRGGLLARLRGYLRVAVLFVRTDPWMTIYPGTAFAVVAAHHARLAPAAFALAIVEAAVYMTGFLALHAISSQLVSVEEDRINKPWRPIPSGLIPERVARTVQGAVMVLFPLTGLLFGVLWWALLWEVIVLSDARTN
ncbi:hypothetical protein J7E97_19915 [Streptomyces sp. ISL-66]|uniref:UbiA family prenyltransferase n=1 Tax=Streptomyces sp. ISL-66 TaxID=2819186 RepID=UPI001BEA96C1|nr:UbiA family prenyltransferase [Streptomyces sp. ISL-66]MBT2470080.1 hypothetical protein [Streptomyces sp. ISL-66]